MTKQKPERRGLQELNLLDDFLFGTTVTYPGIGERFVRSLLETIFDRPFGRLKIVPQKTYYGLDTDRHGVRLDVYLEETEVPENMEEAVIYDLEPDQNDKPEQIHSLPKRTRFYHAMIDARSLQSGVDYSCLKKVFVIMITNYDPFGYNRMVYTVRRMCEEDREIPYDDDARTIYLYTKGTVGDPRQELQEMLHYIADTRRENAVNATLQGIQQMVDTIKQDKGVSLEYMKAFEHDQKMREEGREEERENTQRESKRADAAEERASILADSLALKMEHPDWGYEEIAKACNCTPEDIKRL